MRAAMERRARGGHLLVELGEGDDPALVVVQLPPDLRKPLGLERVCDRNYLIPWNTAKSIEHILNHTSTKIPKNSYSVLYIHWTSLVL